MTESATKPANLMPATTIALKRLSAMRKIGLKYGYAIRPSYAPKMYEPSPNVATVVARMAQK
jgi:hypothetical protein